MSTGLDLPDESVDPEAPVPRIVWWGRLIVLTVLGVYAVVVMTSRLTEPAVLLHLSVILFHEAGHVIFAPFGETIRVAGGAIGQLLMPLVCAIALYRRGDRFGAAIAAAWMGLSLIDAAVYAYDAADPMLPLIGGGTGADSFHDFIFLFDRFDQLDHARAWARGMRVIGSLGVIASLTWAMFALGRQRIREDD